MTYGIPNKPAAAAALTFLLILVFFTLLQFESLNLGIFVTLDYYKKKSQYILGP